MAVVCILRQKAKVTVVVGPAAKSREAELQRRKEKQKLFCKLIQSEPVP
ncbi:predicted protein [Histoplasma capsulatum var. duboisii H88]|uniref:Predicted protein n=1 Tax=Ajellomyces capsulatus (strain H88) TaxID=544711 RepID=F0ULK0_AJEC8|nr:predicted protein [Histoplasma capsulatum var. duboisii H88]